MRKTILSLVAAFLAPFALFAADPFNDAFTDTRMETYLVSPGRDAFFKEVPGMTGKKCMAIAYDNELDAEFHAVPLTDSKAYVLSFRGQWENSETLDNNPTYEAAVEETWRLVLSCIPTMNIVFLDAEGKALNDELFMTMPYGKWREYKNVFFPPSGAAFMKLKIKGSRYLGVFYVDNIKFEPIKSVPGETVLSFENKPDCIAILYGLNKSMREAKSLTYGECASWSAPISLNGSGKYRLSFKGEIMRGRDSVAAFEVLFIDSSGKVIGNVRSEKLDSEPLDFTFPEEASRIKLKLHHHRPQEIKITKF